MITEHMKEEQQMRLNHEDFERLITTESKMSEIKYRLQKLSQFSEILGRPIDIHPIQIEMDAVQRHNNLYCKCPRCGYENGWDCFEVCPKCDYCGGG